MERLTLIWIDLHSSGNIYTEMEIFPFKWKCLHSNEKICIPLE